MVAGLVAVIGIGVLLPIRIEHGAWIAKTFPFVPDKFHVFNGMQRLNRDRRLWTTAD